MSNKIKYIPRMLSLYRDEIVNKLMKDLNITNVMLVPKVEKIVLNMGLGDAKSAKNSLKQAQDEIGLISGQKPVITYAKKAISNFKIREGDPVGVKVTLRSTNMYEFLDRFISIASPRIRDFRGISEKGFDGRGNYNFGIDEQIIFPEVNYDKINEIRGMNCTIVTNTNNDDEAYSLIKAFGFPIKEMIAPAEAAKMAAAKAAEEAAVVAAKKAAVEEVATEEAVAEKATEEEVAAEEAVAEKAVAKKATEEEVATEEAVVEKATEEEVAAEEAVAEKASEEEADLDVEKNKDSVEKE
jgi:large subunit ribosomal protein L5